MSVLLLRVDGTLSKMIRATVESAPFSVIIGDYDGDDRLDLVTASTSRNLTLLSNRGPGFGDEISGGDPPVPTPPDRVTFFPANETDVLQVQNATVFFTDNVVFTASVSTLTPGSSGGAAGGGLPVLDEVVVEAVTVDVTSQDELLVLPESRAADVAKFDIAEFEPPLPRVEGEPKAASDPNGTSGLCVRTYDDGRFSMRADR